MTEPIACPWCRKLPAVLPVDPKREGNAWGEVRCENKKCPTYNHAFGYGVSVGDGSSTVDERGSAAYKRLAIRRWNRWSKP